MRRWLIMAVLIVPAAATAQPARIDECGGAPFQRYIGKPAKGFPLKAHPQARLLCEDCPTTREYLVGRLNVIYSRPSGRIVALTCG